MLRQKKKKKCRRTFLDRILTVHLKFTQVDVVLIPSGRHFCQPDGGTGHHTTVTVEVFCSVGDGGWVGVAQQAVHCHVYV